VKGGRVVGLLIVFYPKILFARDGSRVSSGLVDQRKIAPLAWGRPRVQIPTSPFIFLSIFHFFHHFSPGKIVMMIKIIFVEKIEKKILI
jgi:hypothetical protein